VTEDFRGTVAVIGGTGPQGRGLVLRWAAAGIDVVIGSRERQRAVEMADAVAARLNAIGRGRPPRGAENVVAARTGEVVVLTVPFPAQPATLASIASAVDGKVLIDVAVPLRPPGVWRISLPPAGSAAAEARSLLGPGVQVVAAFQNVAATSLWDIERTIDCDVLVCGDDDRAKRVALSLASAAGMQGLDAGPLDNAGVVDGLTSILAGLNRQHKVRGAGIRVTGLPRG
jgi:hypothetical protein